VAPAETPETYIFKPLNYAKIISYSNILNTDNTLNDELPIFLSCNFSNRSYIGKLDLSNPVITSLCKLPPLGTKENTHGFIEKILVRQKWVRQGYAFLFNEEYLRLRDSKRNSVYAINNYGTLAEIHALQAAIPFFTSSGFFQFKGTPEQYIISMIVNYLEELLFDPYEQEFGPFCSKGIKSKIEELSAEQYIYGSSYALMGTILKNIGQYMNHTTLAHCVLAGITIFIKIWEKYFNLEECIYAMYNNVSVVPVFNTGGSKIYSQIGSETSKQEWEVNFIYYGLMQYDPHTRPKAFDYEGISEKITREIHAIAMLGYMAPSKEFLQVFSTGLTVLSTYSSSWFFLACVSKLTDFLKADPCMQICSQFPDAGPTNTDFMMDKIIAQTTPASVPSWVLVFNRWKRVTRRDGE
jgi:hypothetical protein